MVSRILLLLFTMTFAAQLGFGMVVPMLPIYAQDLGASGLWLGIIFAVYSFARFIATPIVGRYSDVYGRRIFIIIGLGIIVAISMTYIVATSPQEVTIIRFVHGISTAMVIPVAMAYTGDIAPKGREGRYLGFFHAFMFMGVGIGPLMGGVFSDMYGMYSAFAAMGLLALANLVFVIAILPESKATRNVGPRSSYRTVMSDRPVQAVLSYRMGNALGQGMVLGFLPIYAVSQLDLPLFMVGLVLSSRWLALSILQGPFGILADRFNHTAMVVTGGIIFALALFAMPVASDGIQLLVLNVIGALGSAISIAPTSAITIIRGRDLGMGTLMGLVNAGHSLGMTAGPLLAGLVFDAIGLDELFYAGGICSAFSVLAFLLFMRGRRVDAGGS